MSRILVAEDDAAVREFVVRVLERQGHEVTPVADGSQALAELSVSAYDLLLTDIVMPVMDGIALSLKAAKICPDIRIVMMSGYAAERQRAHNLDALVRQVVAKPFTLKEIAAVVREALGERSARPMRP